MYPSKYNSNSSQVGSLPPLPNSGQFQGYKRRLRGGCYLIKYTSQKNTLFTYDGTLRVECHSNGQTVSGDLYKREVVYIQPSKVTYSDFLVAQPVLSPAPNPANEIPSFPREYYSYYLRAFKIPDPVNNDFELAFDLYQFVPERGAGWTGRGRFTTRERFTAYLSWMPSPEGFPSRNDYLAGDVKDSDGIVVGRLNLGWISKYLRRATIEIDRTTCAEILPEEVILENGKKITWQSIFDEVGWEIKTHHSNKDISEHTGGWSDCQLHQNLLQLRDSHDLDREWRYHLLCVEKLSKTHRGIMYDGKATESNKILREGAAIASSWVFPQKDKWGDLQGKVFGKEKAIYFRAAIHEIGHAMSLEHTNVDNSFMNTTDGIANTGTLARPFPENVQWSFSPSDQQCLRHLPDIVVRPGGIALGVNDIEDSLATSSEIDIEELVLRASPLNKVVPLGAPVRINLKLVNESNPKREILAPKSLSMNSGLLSGIVINPANNIRKFISLTKCVDEEPLHPLQPDNWIADSVTLLQGSNGALFSMPGQHEIVFSLNWEKFGKKFAKRAKTSVLITSPESDSHAEAAHSILSEPDTLLSLVMGGNRYSDCIQAAIDDPVLHKHYAWIFVKQKIENSVEEFISAASDLIKESTVMSPAEIEKAIKIIEGNTDSDTGTELVNILRNKLGQMQNLS